jgi:serine/threonine protein phosphatase PrpC
MESPTRKIAWRPTGKSVQGASHIRSGKPNQDAICWFLESEDGLPVILAIADGHGSEKCFQSHEGSRLSTEVAVSVLMEFVDKTKDSDTAHTKEAASAKLPKVLERRWKNSVDEHIQNNPIPTVSPGEHLIEEAAQHLQDSNRFHAYGSTLLAVLVAETYILYIQLGDGDILTISPDGDATRPMPDDQHLFANETTSLCLTNASDYFRIHFQVLSEPPPALIILSTDGYLNSFKSAADFLKAGTDISKMVRSEGLDWVSRNLEKWLDETSLEGSGDDITVGIIENLTVRGIDSLLWQNRKYEKRIEVLEMDMQDLRVALTEASAHNESLKKTVAKLDSRFQWILAVMVVLLFACAALVANTQFGFHRQSTAKQIKPGNKPAALSNPEHALATQNAGQPGGVVGSSMAPRKQNRGSSDE